jgi:acyl carrier protein
MVPAAFVWLERMPLTANGKVDHRALPAPPLSRPDLETDLVPPRTALEATLAEIWAEVLGVDRVGVHDNFFHLGGHSLLATQVLSRVRSRLAATVQLKDLFGLPTIAALAESIQPLGWLGAAPDIARDGFEDGEV